MTRNIPLKVFFNSVLIVILLFIAFPVAQAFALPTEIFFSEYIEGSSYNKALEIYNGTGSEVDLTTYTIELYTNGSATASKTVALVGTLADGDVFVIAHEDADPAILAEADQIDPTSNVINFNGDDALVLKNGTTVVDVIGQVGFDPGYYWGSGSVTTQDHTLRRKETVCSGDTDGTNAFDPALEWDGYAKDTFDGFGTHTASCNGAVETAPSVTTTTPSAGAVDIPVDANIEITFSEAVNVVDPWFGIVCSVSGTHTVAVSGGPTTFTLDPDLDFDNSETCTVTVLAAQITDQDTEDPPDFMDGDYVFGFDVEDLVVVEPPEIIITEIMYDPDSPEDDWEWVEIYNADDITIDLAGYVIDDSNNTPHSYANITGGTLAPGEQAVLYNADDLTAIEFQAAWGTVNLIPVYHWSAMGLNNSGDMVSLWENYTSYAGDHAIHANAIDTVNYDGPGFPDPWDKSIYLTDLTADNNQGVNWSTSSDGGVTPLFTGYVSAPAFGNEGEIGSPGIRPTEMCGDPYTPIYDIQGSGFTSPLVYSEVVTEGVVVSDFQYGGLRGYNIQDPSGDDNDSTSDGIFVYDYSTYIDVNVGDYVRVRGDVKEQYGLTEITYLDQVWLCGFDSVAPTPVSLPLTDESDLEIYEGMLVTFPQSLYITEYYNFDYYGEIVVATSRQFQPTALYEPGSPEAVQALVDNLLGRIIVDDGRTWYNPDPARHPNGAEFNLANLFRGGDILNNLTGVVDYAYGEYKIQPTMGADYVNANPRPEAPDSVGGGLTVASFNVLNYFTTIDTGAWICGPSGDMECRGADTALEFTRQRDKIISALLAIDADVVGLIEIENNEFEAVANLVSGLNAVAGAGTYAYVDTGYIGGDAIKVAFIYKPAAVSLVGDYAVLDSSVDPRFIDTKNRPALAQTFMDNTTGGIFTAVVNHLKSKGSPCDDIGDPDIGDGQGNCNLTRTAAAEAMVDWLATDPTGSGDADFLIIGDLNAYDKEDPIDALIAGEYSDLVFQFVGEDAYSYVFDGQLGYLDHGLALANGGLASEVSGATVWHINADEPDLIDYDMNYKQPAQDAIYAPDAYRSSDHDPVLIGLDVCDEIAPTLEIELSTDTLWPANHKYVEVTATVTAADNFDIDPVVTLLSVTSSEEDDDGGDGHTSDDIVIIDDYTFQLRAERSGNSENGRVYTITYQVEDDCGNLTVESATVVVPKSQKKK